MFPDGFVGGLVGARPFWTSDCRWQVYIRMTLGWSIAVAAGAEWRGNFFGRAGAAVGASDGADLPAEASLLPAESLSKTMQKSRHVNNFRGVTANRNGISLNH